MRAFAKITTILILVQLFDVKNAPDFSGSGSLELSKQIQQML